MGIYLILYYRLTRMSATDANVSAIVQCCRRWHMTCYLYQSGKKGGWCDELVQGMGATKK